MILPSGNNMIKSVYALKRYLKKCVSVPKSISIVHGVAVMLPRMQQHVQTSIV